MFEERRPKAHQRLDTLTSQPSRLRRQVRAHEGHRHSYVNLAVGQVPEHEFVFFGGMDADGMLKFHLHRESLSLDQAKAWLEEHGFWKSHYQVEGIQLVEKKDREGNVGHFVLVKNLNHFTIKSRSDFPSFFQS